ncbi:MsnO8 family LLM class oxidoreductase [Actinoplanes sp. RD1]|uniref:MsnO8 family LLM class oxidoreductase n=1 Tax=Actinoplanes sp. RD1 TaxID=3064538 RepID=UPI002741D6A7|nr:MsnO8 family LLM class oxidoreductase [Actinoplanes sp. RD1]
MTTPGRPRLAALDTVMVGHTAEQALADSVDLARHAERLGYSRYWLAEHHGPTAGAGSAPIVTATAVAGATTTIQVGSGGVMIPNHVPLVIAEQFGTLAALHPGRIDLGVGRAAPPDAATAAVFDRHLKNYGADDFADRVDQLVGFLTGRFPSGRRYGQIHVAPQAAQPPAVWVLGTSEAAATVAAVFGLPFAFAHHFGRGDVAAALAHYRANFRPSPTLERPYTLVTLLAVVAATNDEAAVQAGSADLYFHRFFTTGNPPARFPSRDEVIGHRWTQEQRRFADRRRAGQAVGDHEHAGRAIADLLNRTAADELMLTTQLHSLDDRARSLELAAAVTAARHPF